MRTRLRVFCVVVSQWSGDVHARIASAIREARGKRSAQWVADRTAELGHPITRAQIANYENGRKESLDVTDLIVLSVALGTSPVCLIYPGPHVDSVEALPDLEATQFAAAQWFSGIAWYPDVTAGFGWPEWIDSTAQLNTCRRINELETQRLRAMYLHRKRRMEGLPSAAGELAAELAVYDERIQELREQIGLSPGARLTGDLGDDDA